MQTTRSTRTNLDNTIQLHQSRQSSREKVTSMCFGQGLVPLRQVFSFFLEELDFPCALQFNGVKLVPQLDIFIFLRSNLASLACDW